MIPRFSLARPQTLAEAWDAYAESDGDAAYIAGGTELLQVMKMGFAQFGRLIDLKRIPELRGIGLEPDGTLRIGATTTHREIERSPVVREALAPLVALEAHVANVRVRNTGTLGGNLAFAEPHSDPATLLLACDARVELAGPGGSRELGIGDFTLGPLFTARDAEEVLVAIRVPARPSGEGRGYAKLAFFERPAASVGVRVRVADGRVVEGVVAVGSLTETPEIVTAAGDALAGMEVRPGGDPELPPGTIDALAEVDAVADINGSPDYKRHLAGILVRRAFRAAVAEAVVHA